jgi:transcriptional regulator with XRE-family HTH domain
MVRIIPCTNATELFRHYDGETKPQPAYIELDTQAGTLYASYNAEIGTALPETVRHGLDRRYEIPVLTADAANRVMEEIAPLADRIIAGTEAVWNGESTVADMNEDAIAAEEEIEKFLGLPTIDGGHFDEDTQGFPDSDLVGVWDIDAAVNGQEADEYGITADTTDARLEQIEQAILGDLQACGEHPVVVCHGLDSYLKQLRDGLADEDPITPAELRIAREELGLTGDHLARLLRVNPRTLRSWEQGRDPIPGRIRPEIAELREETAAAVAKLVESVDDEDTTIVTYRSDEEYAAAHRGGRWSASWHRQVAARAAAATGARIDYADIEDDETAG